MVGALLGAVLGVTALSEEGPPEWNGVMLCIVLGATAGSLFVLQDLTCRNRVPPSALFYPRAASIFAIAQLMLCFVPVLGLMVSGVALALNWRAQGAQNIICWIGFLIAAFIVVAFSVMIINAAN